MENISVTGVRSGSREREKPVRHQIPVRMVPRHTKMSISVIVPFMMSVFVIATCQQPVDDVSVMSPFLPAVQIEKDLLKQCETFALAASEENQRLRKEIEILKLKVEALEEEEEYGEEDGSNESKEPSRSLRSKRAAACDGGTLAAWACAPQCVFKLKGLCGLSLKSICHC